MALQAENEAAKAAAGRPAADEFMLHAADDGGAPSLTAAPMHWGTRVSAVGMQRVAAAAHAAAPCIGVPMGRPAPLHGPRLDLHLRRLSPPAAQIDTSMYISALAPPSSTHLLTYRASALLKAAAAHRTFVEYCLGGQQLTEEDSLSISSSSSTLSTEAIHQQQQLAELMDQQMTGEEAIEVAISLGMPRPSTAM